MKERLEPAECEALGQTLAVLAERESKIAEALYPLFFARRPDVVPLFGRHALAEREEMVRETLRSLLALAEGDSTSVEASGTARNGPGHLAANLVALGRSHAEYGVTADMYPDFVDAFVEVAADGLPPDRRALLQDALRAITQAMRRAGEPA